MKRIQEVHKICIKLITYFYFILTHIKIHCFILIVSSVGGLLCKTSVATVRIPSNNHKIVVRDGGNHVRV